MADLEDALKKLDRLTQEEARMANAEVLRITHHVRSEVEIIHNESGQKADIADYIRNIVNLSPSTAMRRWREDDKNLVIDTLTERADGM